MKPPFPYFGGKITLGPTIASLFPPHEHYVEPYCGSLAVLLAKQPSVHETVNDLDGALMTFWRVLRERPQDLERECALTPHSRSEYVACRDLDGCDELETARRVWVDLTQGRAGMRKATGWRHVEDPVGTPTSMPGYLSGYVGRIAPAAARLAGVSLENKPAVELIAKYGRHPEVLLYVDPPYLHSARTGSTWNGYAHEMRTDAEHRELAAVLRGCAAMVVLSGYASSLYDLELFPDWHRREFPATTGQGGVWANRTEVLWSNRPLADSQPSLFEGVAG